jgi:hypothetical protein
MSDIQNRRASPGRQARASGRCGSYLDIATMDKTLL